MSAGVFKDPFIDCDGCKRRLFGSQVRLTAGGMTVAKVRKAAAKMGWKVNIENITYQDEREIRRGECLDLCPACRREAA